MLFLALVIGTSSTATTSEDRIVIDPDPPVETEVDFWDIRARTALRFDTRIAIDTSFDRREEQVGELWLGGRLELDIDLAESVKVYAAPNFQWVGSLDREGDDRQFLYLVTPEAHVSWAEGPFVLRAGALVFSWGPSDIIAPNDLLNPIDYRRSLLGFSDEAKIPVLAVEGGATFGPVNLRAVIEPFFTASRFHLAAWDFSALQAGVFPLRSDFPIDYFFSEAAIDSLGNELLATERPSDRPDNATFAGRATLSLGNVLDLSLNAVYGWDTLPAIIIDDDLLFLANTFADSRARGEEFPLADEEVLDAIERVREAVDQGRKIARGTYLRRSVLGFDAVLALDPVVLKVDVAFSFQHTVYTQALEPKSHPWLNAVLGLEYFDGEAFQIILELFAITVFDVPSEYRLIFFESTGLPHDAPGERTVVFPGLAGAVRYSILQGDLRFELGASATLRGDVLILPSILWNVSDAHHVILGGMAVEGRNGSYGASYTHTDQLFVAYRLSY
jgi:hypothetical protein